MVKEVQAQVAATCKARRETGGPNSFLVGARAWKPLTTQETRVFGGEGVLQKKGLLQKMNYPPLSLVQGQAGVLRDPQESDSRG